MRCSSYVWQEHKELKNLKFLDEYGDHDWDAEQEAYDEFRRYGDPHTTEGVTHLMRLMNHLFDQERYSSVVFLWKNDLKYAYGWEEYDPHSKRLTDKIGSVEAWIYCPARIIWLGENIEEAIHQVPFMHEIRERYWEMQRWVVRKDYIDQELPEVRWYGGLGGVDQDHDLDHKEIERRGKRFNMYVHAMELVQPYKQHFYR